MNAPKAARPKWKCVSAFEASGSMSLNIEILGQERSRPCQDTSQSPYATVTGRFGSPAVVRQEPTTPTESHNSLHDTLDWSKIDCHEFLRMAREISVDNLFNCIIGDKMYSKTGERPWELSEFVLQRKDRRMFIGGQGVVLFVRRQGHSTSLAMKVCYHRREERKVERHVQRTILHLKSQGVSQFVGKILVNYLTRRFFVTIMPKSKFSSLKALKQEIGFLSDANIRYFFTCIASAIVKLHAIQICHRDIKCDNVLVMHSGAPALVDFGLAVRGAQSTDDYRPNARVTQMQYYPAETKQIGSLVNDYKIDSWLMGFFLCEMVLNEREHLWTKFKNTNLKDWKFATCSVCKEAISPQVTTVLSKLLVRDPKDRMHVTELQNTPYLQEGGNFKNIEDTEPPSFKKVGSEPTERDLSEG